MSLSDAVGTGLVLVAAGSLVYSWYFYLTRMSWKSSGWRARVSLTSLCIVSLTVVMWPIMFFMAPRYVDEPQQIHWVLGWGRVAFWCLFVALVLGLFRRPRMILPLAAACIGIGLFWIFSTMP